MRTLLALIFAITTARAADLADLARANPTFDARQLIEAATAPAVVLSTNTVEEAKAEDAVAWERFALGELEGFVEAVTGSRSNAVARINALTEAEILAAVRTGKGRGATARDAILDRTDAVALVYLAALRRGYDLPLPADFGQATRRVAVVTRSRGPSWWEIHAPGMPAPTKAQAIAALRASRE